MFTFLLVPFAGFWAYIGFCFGTCGPSEAIPGVLLFAAVLFSFGLLAWNWQPYRPRIAVAPEGLTFECAGMVFVPRRTLAWDRIAAFAWVPGGAYGATGFFRIEESPSENAKRGKTHDVPLKGLGAMPQAILDAIRPHLAEIDRRLDGELKTILFTTKRVEVVQA